MKHDPKTHGDRCSWDGTRDCSRPVKWHVDCAATGCGNFCGIHARVVQRRSLWSAVFSKPVIVNSKERSAA